MESTNRQPSRPRREPKQSRSRLLMQSVREACITLIQEVGAEALTTTRIADRAGISIGSFYQYYPNVESVLTDIYENILDSLSRELTEQTTSKNSGMDRGLRENIQDGFVVTFALHRELLAIDPSFYLAFLRDFNITAARGPSSNKSWNEWAVNWFIALLKKEELRAGKDPEFVARLMVDITSGTVQRLAETHPEALSDPNYVEELTDLFCRYILD